MKHRRDEIARLAREEHESGEDRRRTKKKLRGFKKKESMPRTLRARRTAGKRGEG